MANIEKDIQKMELDFSQVTRTKAVLNQNQVQKLWNSTPRKFKYKRPARGGGQWDYVKVSYVRKVLTPYPTQPTRIPGFHRTPG